MNIIKVMIINIFMIALLCIPNNIESIQNTFIMKIVSYAQLICAGFFIFLLGISEIGLTSYDYSETNSIAYDKIVFAENDFDSEDTTYYVYLENGDKYRIRNTDAWTSRGKNTCDIEVNNDYFQNCFVPEYEKYRVYNKYFYDICTTSHNTLYVDQKLYDKITEQSYTETVITDTESE